MIEYTRKAIEQLTKKQKKERLNMSTAYDVLSANFPVIEKKLTAKFNKVVRDLKKNQKSIINTFNAANHMVPSFCYPSDLRRMPSNKCYEVKSMTLVDGKDGIPYIDVTFSMFKDQHHSIIADNYIRDLPDKPKSEVGYYLKKGYLGAMMQLDCMENAFYLSGMEVDAKDIDEEKHEMFYRVFFPKERLLKKKGKNCFENEYFETFSDDWYMAKIKKM